MTRQRTRRKVFVSFYRGDDEEVLSFARWARDCGAFVPKVVHEGYSGAWMDSTNPEYIMARIRHSFLVDSSVTMVLLGPCTHSRRYVDWELKASLRSGESYNPNGVLGVTLPSVGKRAIYLPPRLEENLESGYACYYPTPSDAQELWSWIEDAYEARTKRLELIQNSSEMMRYNARCRHCGVTHPAS